MSVSYSAEAGYGVRLKVEPKDLLDPKFDDFKEYVWEHADEHARNYYENVDQMLDEDNFDLDSVGEAFPALRFVWCGNPYSTKREKDQWFAVAATTYTKVDDSGYEDLSKRSKVTAEAAQQLNSIRLITLDSEEPRWWLWFNIG